MQHPPTHVSATGRRRANPDPTPIVARGARRTSKTPHNYSASSRCGSSNSASGSSSSSSACTSNETRNMVPHRKVELAATLGHTIQTPPPPLLPPTAVAALDLPEEAVDTSARTDSHHRQPPPAGGPLVPLPPLANGRRRGIAALQAAGTMLATLGRREAGAMTAQFKGETSGGFGAPVLLKRRRPPGVQLALLPGTGEMMRVNRASGRRFVWRWALLTLTSWYLIVRLFFLFPLFYRTEKGALHHILACTLPTTVFIVLFP